MSKLDKPGTTPERVLFIALRVFILSLAQSTEACWDVCLPYNGTTNITESGLQCQSWRSQVPNRNRFNNDTWFPGEGLDGAQNYCREPMGDLFKPWCYTMDPNTAYEYCTIPLCNSTYLLRDNKEFYSHGVQRRMISVDNFLYF